MENLFNKHKSLQQKSLPDFVQNFKNEVDNLNLPTIELVKKKLNFLCLEFDPYNLNDEDQTLTTLIEEFELRDFLENPFTFTNIVLQLLDIVEEAIKTKTPKAH